MREKQSLWCYRHRKVSQINARRVAAKKSPKAFHLKVTGSLTEGGRGKVVIEVNSPDEVKWLISESAYISDLLSKLKI